MITNPKQLDGFYRDLDAREHLSPQEAMAIYDMLYKEAAAVGTIHSGNKLEGIEVDIRIAKAIDSIGYPTE